jgi:hypothetical protein
MLCIDSSLLEMINIRFTFQFNENQVKFIRESSKSGLKVSVGQRKFKRLK